jgi:hypothetical protein
VGVAVHRMPSGWLCRAAYRSVRVGALIEDCYDDLLGITTPRRKGPPFASGCCYSFLSGSVKARRCCLSRRMGRRRPLAKAAVDVYLARILAGL